MSAGNLDAELATAAAWIKAEAARAPYAEIGVRFILHGGVVTRVERATTVKLQPEAGNGNARQR
jgi:hypothetical protein